MNWLVFALTLGGLYLIAFARLIRRHGWDTAAALVGILHLMFATANSAAPFRALIDGMYMGWQIGLLRFEGRAAAFPSAIVLAWALISLWLCAARPASRWMRVITWGDLFWLMNISAAMLMMLLSGELQKAKDLYPARGILDKTHLRLFTRRTARELLEKNGYRILDEKLTVMPLELIFGLSPENFLMKLMNRTLRVFTALMPGLLGYQIMLVVEPKQRAA